MTEAQIVVNKVDAKQQSSVESSLTAVEGAISACEKAGRNTERDELVKAKNQLRAHLDYMKRKAAEPPPQKLSVEQIAALVKNGDPGCPKGQAYRRSPTQEIRCIGPQIVDMNWKSADAYFTGRGYKMATTPAPPTLKAEYGAELVVFKYAAINDDQAAQCVTYYPVPGMSWQEATARVTGTALRKLDNAKAVKTDRGDLPLRVDQSDTKLIIYVGQC